VNKPLSRIHSIYLVILHQSWIWQDACKYSTKYVLQDNKLNKENIFYTITLIYIYIYTQIPGKIVYLITFSFSFLSHTYIWLIVLI